MAQNNRNHTQTAEEKISDVETCEIMVSIALVGIDVRNRFGIDNSWVVSWGQWVGWSPLIHSGARSGRRPQPKSSVAMLAFLWLYLAFSLAENARKIAI